MLRLRRWSLNRSDRNNVFGKSSVFRLLSAAPNFWQKNKWNYFVSKFWSPILLLVAFFFLSPRVRIPFFKSGGVKSRILINPGDCWFWIWYALGVGEFALGRRRDNLSRWQNVKRPTTNCQTIKCQVTKLQLPVRHKTSPGPLNHCHVDLCLFQWREDKQERC